MQPERHIVESVYSPLVRIDYTNHRGERAERVIKPCWSWYGHSKYHQGAQWFWHAWEPGREVYRDFAVEGIHSWTQLPLGEEV